MAGGPFVAYGNGGLPQREEFAEDAVGAKAYIDAYNAFLDRIKEERAAMSADIKAERQKSKDEEIARYKEMIELATPLFDRVGNIHAPSLADEVNIWLSNCQLALECDNPDVAATCMGEVESLLRANVAPTNSQQTNEGN